MPFEHSIEIDCNRGIARGTLSGEVSNSAELVDMFSNLFASCQEQSLKAVLLDIRELEMDYTAIDIMETFKVFQGREWLNGLKLARVVRESDTWHNLIGDYANKLELPVRNFYDIASAERWLLG